MPDTFGHTDKLRFQKRLVDQNIVFEDCRFDLDVIVSQDNYKGETLRFSKCVFKGIVSFKDIDLKYGVQFVDCEFSKELIFKEVKTNGIKKGFNDKSISLLFDNCRLQVDLNIVGCLIDRAISILNKSVMAGTVNLNNVETEGVLVEESEVGRVDIRQTSSRIGIRFDKSIISGTGRFFRCSGSNISYTKSTIKGNQIHNGHKLNSLITNYGTFEDELKVQGCSVDSISLFDTSFEKAVHLSPIDDTTQTNAPINKVFLNDSRFNAGFNFTGEQGKYKSNWRVEMLNFRCSALLSGNIVIQGIDFNSVAFNGTNVNGNILMRDCGVSSVSFDGFSNSANITFANIKAITLPDSLWSIQNAILGKINLLNIDFSSFGKFLIQFSSLTEISFSYVNWDLSGRLNMGLDKKDRIIANRELYRQLKYAADRQGDRIQALAFKAKEMTYLRQALKSKKWSSIEHLGNHCMMWLNKSNNYGQDWGTPLLLLLGLNIICYFLILVSYSQDLVCDVYFSMDSLNTTWKIFKDNFAKYWSLLNPVRRLKDVFPSETYSAWTTFWDFINRIVVTYFIFQIVSAFRKYVN